jgi:metal-responsive CopG/Arc/MetJ family transcriptional regulator
MDRRTYTSTSIYPDDLKVIDDFCKRKELKNRAEGLRIAIQYANAHGALK